MTARPRRVVIVAYGAAQLLAHTLAELDGTERVVVVDNSSSQQVRAISEAANAEYFDPGRNLGFAAGVNLALRGLPAADVDVLLLNPDARISSAQIDVLQNELSRHSNDDVAAVSPALMHPCGTPQRVLWPFPSPAGMWREAFGLARFAHPRRGFVVGAVLLLRREALAAVGEFDERFFLYAEETDWQRRAAQLGWRSAVLDEVTALHVGAGTSVDSVQRLALFHAAQETYIRRWFGPLGWLSYRLAVLLGALLRTVVTMGPKRRHHWARARLYLAGPRRRAAPTSSPRLLRVTHVVVTGNAAGTERYLCQVATLQAAAGHQVTVIGGDPTYMRSALPSTAVWRPGETPRRAWQALLTGGAQDVVHAHLSAADFVAVAAAPCHGGKVISTRHIAKARGSSRPVRLMFRMLQRRITTDVCMSEQVGRAVGPRATVLPAGIRPDVRLASAESRVIVMAQRLEPEKASDVALAGWAESGLDAQGWTLVICGDGSQREQLQHLVARIGIRGVQWRGWDEDLRSTLLQAAALLAPCPVESFGLAVVEAMSIGLPVVAAAGGGHLETVGRYPGALLFAPGDVQDCARQLAVLAAMTPTASAAYGAALQQLQRSRFDIADHVARLDDVYRSALDRGPVG